MRSRLRGGTLSIKACVTSVRRTLEGKEGDKGACVETRLQAGSLHLSNYSASETVSGFVYVYASVLHDIPQLR